MASCPIDNLAALLAEFEQDMWWTPKADEARALQRRRREKVRVECAGGDAAESAATGFTCWK